MRYTVRLPKLGDTADEVLVVEWSVQVGSELDAGAPLLRVETDKVEVDVPSPVAGRLVDQLVAVEDEIPVGTAIAVIET